MAVPGQSTVRKDNWSSQAYQASAKFVPQLTSKVVGYLNPQAGDKILDLGCGDGILTHEIAKVVSLKADGAVVGLDASPSMIIAAQEKYLSSADSLRNSLAFYVQDCTAFSEDERSRFLTGKWDKVFSNAALHWILRKEETQEDVLRAAFDALRLGGEFVFEMGGHGNVADAQAAITAALIAQGVSAAKARDACPWFFPSTEWMRSKLSGVGFEVQICEIEYRPTRLTEDAKGGLEGWVRLMGAEFLEVLSGEKGRDEAVKMVGEILERVVTRPEDGSKWLGYVRLRCKARKPE